MPHDVFIAYSRADKLAADAVCHRLEDAGIRCWVAPRDIGDDRGRNSAIVEAVGGSKLAVVIFSAAAATAPDLLDEVAVVLDSEIVVVPFRVEDIAGSVRNAADMHWLDALNEPLNAHIDRLIDRVRRNLSDAAFVAEPAERDRPTPTPLPAPVPAASLLAETAIPRFAEAAMPPPAAVVAPPRPVAAAPSFGEPAAASPEAENPRFAGSEMPAPAKPAVPRFVGATSRRPQAVEQWRRWLPIVVALALALAAVVAVVGHRAMVLSAAKPPSSGQTAQPPAAPVPPPAPPPATAQASPEPKPAPVLEPKPPATPKPAPAPQPPVTVPRSLSVAGNSEAVPIEIPPPTDPDYPASILAVTITGLPSNGTVVMSEGKSPVAVGQTLKVAELTGLKFAPTADVFASGSTLTYTVKNPVGLSADGSVSLTIEAKPPEPTPPEAVAQGVAAFDRGNYVEAMRWYRVAADRGNADAQTNIGVLYGLGLGVKRDYDEALKWYRLAADQGSPQAQRNVGLFYQNGWAVDQDYAEALRWYRKAADQGEARAQGSIGTLYQTGRGVKKDYAKAMHWFRLAADQGDAKSQVSIGHLYDKGLGVDQSYTEAMRWFRLAADQGDAKGQASVGYLYETGHGVPQDYAEAMRWFRLAADQGNAQAQSNIGALYANGWGVKRDTGQARAWMEKAAAAGDAFAKRWLSEH